MIYTLHIHILEGARSLTIIKFVGGWFGLLHPENMFCGNALCHWTVHMFGMVR